MSAGMGRAGRSLHLVRFIVRPLGGPAMGEMPLGADELKAILVVVVLLAAGTAGALLHMRHEWRALRHKLFQPEEGKAGWSRPSRVSERLDPSRLGDEAREMLGRLG